MVTLHRAKERALIAQTTIDLILVIQSGRKSHKSPRVGIGGQVEMLMISGVVLIGHVAGKPRTALQIARHLGIPRATVVRKLATLERLGVVGRTGSSYCMTDRPDADYSYVDGALAVIRRATTK